MAKVRQYCANSLLIEVRPGNYAIKGQLHIPLKVK